MFEFPEDQSSYEDIENKILLGDAFLIYAFNDTNETDKEFSFPKAGFNKYPQGKLLMNKNNKKNKITLSGKLDEINIFLRQGYIIPRQNTFDKYILNTMKLRQENLDLIINIDNSKRSKGVIFFDNDDINVISNKRYIRVDLSFSENKLYVNTNKNNLRKYKYNDNILGIIELWNAKKVYKEIKDAKKCNIEINYYKGRKYIEGKYDEDNNKIVYNINEKVKDISLFDVKNIVFNFKK